MGESNTWGGDKPTAAINPSEATSPATSLSERGFFIISEAFTNVLAKNVITWILEANFAATRKYDHLTLVINSPGGEVNSAFAIIDTMRGSAIPIHTVGLGEVSSCGLLTFMAGAKGHRTLTPNTSVLSHQWAWGAWGKEHELFSRVREFDLTTQRIMNHYKRVTGLTEEMIREKLLPPSDVWLSGEEAKALGLCDDIKDIR